MENTSRPAGQKFGRAGAAPWQAQYLRVLELCLALNPAPSLQQGEARPAAFCDFMGHTGSFFVTLFLGGWRPDAKEDLACAYKNGAAVAGCPLPELIALLEGLAAEAPPPAGAL